MTLRRSWIAAAAAAAVVALTGCSAAGGPAAVTSTDYWDVIDASPLAQYLLPTGQGGRTDEQQIADTTALQELIATCMAAQGFDYTPVPWTPYDTSFPGDWRPDDRDWVSQWGYGATGFPAMADMLADEKADPDPNASYYASLSPAEQAAYSATAYGAEYATAESTWADMGCYGAAHNEYYGDDPRESDEFKPLMTAISQFQAGELQAPEFAGLDAEWADCMAGEGHPGFTRQGDAQRSIEDQRYEIYSTADSAIEMDDPVFDALHQQEIALALDDLDCREQIDYRDRAREIQYSLENRFIADHESELDELVAAAQAAKAAAARSGATP